MLQVLTIYGSKKACPNDRSCEKEKEAHGIARHVFFHRYSPWFG
jgi:hypothetical protein